MSPEELESIENPDPRRAEDGEATTLEPVDEIIVDGRIVGGPHADRDDRDPLESPEHDAEVQSGGE